MSADPIALARDLLRCPSVTPAEGGALTVLEKTLKRCRFHRAPHDVFGCRHAGRREFLCPHRRQRAASDVRRPHRCGAARQRNAWSHPPFAGEIANGTLYGRGAVDMKGGIAACVAAVLDHLAENGGKPKGSISFLITGDEESVAINGTTKLLKWAAEHGEKFDHCILAEPSNVDTLGDTIKIGRRGSLNGTLIVTGKQGHVAYPHRADNPVRGIVTLISAINARAARRRQRLFRSVQSGIRLRRCRQQDRQSHPRRSACAFQHPLQ